MPNKTLENFDGDKEIGSQEPNVLSNDVKRFVISYRSMEELIKNHYKQNGKDVKVKIKYTASEDDGIYHQPAVLTIEVKEAETILGLKQKQISTNTLSMRDLRKILSESLGKEGKTLLKVENNATKSSRIVGYGMGEHEETVITGKNFTVTVK